jgi:hypothetical protein
MEWQSVKELKGKDIGHMLGVNRKTFDRMLLAMFEYELQHLKYLKRGRLPKLTVEDKVLMMLMYYREYRTFFHTAGSCGISGGQYFRIIVKLENILIQSGLFRLPGKKSLLPSQHDWEVVLIEVSESSVKRPKKNSGAITQVKKKRHILKTQLIVDTTTHKIICVAVAKGKRHDLRVFKKSNAYMHSSIHSINYSGYQGIQRLNSNTTLPFKGSKKATLEPGTEKT